jgi:two-component system, cell cycle response regulator
MPQTIIDELHHINLLPSPPTLAMKVLDLVREDAPIEEIADMISRDPALAAKLLKTANSSFYRRSHTVSTIKLAATLLGLQTLRTLVLGFSFVQRLKTHKPRAFDYQKYWCRSIYAATAARALASKLKLIQREECFLAALLGDIGMLALDQVCDTYTEVCRSAKTHDELAEIELDVLRLTHADASGLLARQWKLPAILAIPMGAHHRPESATDAFGKKMAQIVHIAGLAADVFLEDRAAQTMLQVFITAKDQLAIDQRDSESILAEVAATAGEVAPLFDITMQPLPDLIGIAVKAAQLAMPPKRAVA